MTYSEKSTKLYRNDNELLLPAAICFHATITLLRRWGSFLPPLVMRAVATTTGTKSARTGKRTKHEQLL